MRVLFDTSVIVAGLLSGHGRHADAHPWLSRANARSIEMLVSGHSLAEVYAVLTRLPAQPRITAEMAWQLVLENIIKCAELVTLSGADYRALVEDLSLQGMAGGVVYDAVIARAASLAQADYLLTFNVHHFQRLWPEGAGRVVHPHSEIAASS
ncbi:MAG: PIN domain-containing protein [Acidobacteria bacterium]|nr:PIN domain-containing protein [Acidobacteriota bacterium]MCI0622923.1 PIN domain-containing protein [Acidobacteriota bacterium]